MATREDVERWRTIAGEAVGVSGPVMFAMSLEDLQEAVRGIPAMADMLLRAEYIVECAGPGVTGRYEWLRDWRGEGNDG